MELKSKIFTRRTKDADEYKKKSYDDLRHETLRDVYEFDIDASNIISVIEKSWEDDVSPVICDSRTWFKRKNFSLVVYYRDN